MRTDASEDMVPASDYNALRAEHAKLNELILCAAHSACLPVDAGGQELVDAITGMQKSIAGLRTENVHLRSELSDYADMLSMTALECGEKLDQRDALLRDWLNGNCSETLERQTLELLAASPTRKVLQSLAIPDECPHMIVFDDAERENELFAGKGARPAALERWEQISTSWNAHLFVRIELNSRDGDQTCAMAQQVVPVVVEAVAVTKKNEGGDLYLDWILEGGISALEFPGQRLLIAHGQVTGDDGSGEVFTACCDAGDPSQESQDDA